MDFLERSGPERFGLGRIRLGVRFLVARWISASLKVITGGIGFVFGAPTLVLFCLKERVRDTVSSVASKVRFFSAVYLQICLDFVLVIWVDFLVRAIE